MLFVYLTKPEATSFCIFLSLVLVKMHSKMHNIKYMHFSKSKISEIKSKISYSPRFSEDLSTCLQKTCISWLFHLCDLLELERLWDFQQKVKSLGLMKFPLLLLFTWGPPTSKFSFRFHNLFPFHPPPPPTAPVAALGFQKLRAKPCVCGGGGGGREENGRPLPLPLPKHKKEK